MKSKRRDIVATVEYDEPGIAFKVTAERTITLTFPNAVYSYSGAGRLPFNRKLTPDEAREVAGALIEAADEVTSAK